MKKLSTRLLQRLICLSSLLWLSNAYSTTLPEVIQRVLNEHPDVRSSYALLQASDAQLKQTYSNFLPIADFTYRYSDSDDETAGRPTTREVRRLDGTARWNVFNGLSDWYGMRSAQLSKGVAESNLAEAQDAVALRLTELYVDILRLSERVKTTKIHLLYRKKLVKDVKKRAELGRISKADEFQAIGRMIDTEHDLSLIQGQLAGLKDSFKEITGFSATQLEEPDIDLDIIKLPYQELLNKAIADNSRYRSALRQVDVQDAQVKVVTGDFFPDVDLEYRKRITSDISPAEVTDTDQLFSLQINYQIPLGGSMFTRRSEAVERKYAAMANADSEILNVKTRLVELRQKLKKAHLIQPRLKEHTELLSDVYHSYVLQFSAGKRSLLDLLILLDERYRAETSLTDNYYQIYVDSANIHREIGQLRLLGLATGQ